MAQAAAADTQTTSSLIGVAKGVWQWGVTQVARAGHVASGGSSRQSLALRLPCLRPQLAQITSQCCHADMHTPHTGLYIGPQAALQEAPSAGITHVLVRAHTLCERGGSSAASGLRHKNWQQHMSVLPPSAHPPCTLGPPPHTHTHTHTTTTTQSVVNYEVQPLQGLCHWAVPLEDCESADLLHQLPPAVTWLERALRQAGSRVLVHCHAGGWHVCWWGPWGHIT
jgi:hypothetical protein